MVSDTRKENNETQAVRYHFRALGGGLPQDQDRHPGLCKVLGRDGKVRFPEELVSQRLQLT